VITKQDRLSYDLSKKVPDMQCGFRISTSYGDIHVGAQDAEAFQRLAELMLTRKLENAIAAEKQMKEMGDGH